MGPFLKTLFGDIRNVVAVVVLLGMELALVHAGYGRGAIMAGPVATMAAVAWLALR